jgi:T-complex protein 1 subunit gamma
MTGIALDAVKTVFLEQNGKKEIDIKRYVRIEKVRRVFSVLSN